MRTLLALALVSLSAAAGLDAKDARRAEARRAEADEAWREARLRPQDPRLAGLLRAGMARSATFRSLVNRLEAGNVIVYMSLSQNLKSNVAGKLTWITKAGSFRYVKATLNMEQSANQLIATLAHEMQHALEVSQNEDVVDQRSLLALYRRIGRPIYPGVTDTWETEAAQDMAFQVRRELLTT